MASSMASLASSQIESVVTDVGSEISTTLLLEGVETPVAGDHDEDRETTPRLLEKVKAIVSSDDGEDVVK